MSSVVQSITFSRDQYTTKQALRWLRQHDKNPIKKVDKTATRLRYRLVDPSEFDHFATKVLSDGIEFIIGFPESENQKPDPFPASSQQPAPGPPKGGKNTWIMHVKAYRASHPNVSYKDALKLASASWKK